jgi:hypothetical protein
MAQCCVHRVKGKKLWQRHLILIILTIFLISAISAVSAVKRDFTVRRDIDRTFGFSRWLKKLAVAALLLYRRARYGYPYRRIRLAGPSYAKVDPEDYDRFKDHEWYAAGCAPHFYANRLVRKGNAGKTKFLAMHREIMNPPEGIFIDHINRDKMDNRKANLREATYSQNGANRPKFNRPANSKYKGVSLQKTKTKRTWQATICVNRKRIYLGTFYNEIEAAKAYDQAAKKHHGEFAYLNFPETKKPRKN